MANIINSLELGSTKGVFTLPYGSCSTAAGTAAKTVSVDDFALETGAMVAVKFTVTNTAANPTLNVNSKGAKSIYYRGSAIAAGNLAANRTYLFIYNGTQWDLIGDIDTNTTYSAATTSAAGLMSASDKSKLDGIASGANNYSLPTASSSTLGGVKIGSNINISSGTISVPTADGSTAGVTVVYPAASCTTFSSDSGTVTPAAVQKGAKMFAITRPTSSTNKAITRYSNTTGDVQDSKIIIEDVTNTRDSSKKAQVIAIPAEGGKKMVYGYCTDQVDGTSFIGGVFDADATSYPYAQGLAIGGTTGNLLWKGSKVIDASCIGDYANKYTHPSHPAKSSGLYKITVDSLGHVSSATAVAKSDITALGIPGSDTNTTYTFATGDSNGQIKVTSSGGSAQNISVKGLGSAAYTASTDYATASHTHAASVITAGTFPGNVAAYSTNRSTSGLRNIEIRTSSATGTLQSTNKIIMVRA